MATRASESCRGLTPSQPTLGSRPRLRADQPVRGRSWADGEVGASYGREIAADPRFRGCRWATAEAQFRGEYRAWCLRHGYGVEGSDLDAWGRVEAHARIAWEAACGAAPVPTADVGRM